MMPLFFYIHKAENFWRAHTSKITGYVNTQHALSVSVTNSLCLEEYYPGFYLEMKIISVRWWLYLDRTLCCVLGVAGSSE